MHIVLQILCKLQDLRLDTPIPYHGYFSHFRVIVKSPNLLLNPNVWEYYIILYYFALYITYLT